MIAVMVPVSSVSAPFSTVLLAGVMLAVLLLPTVPAKARRFVLALGGVAGMVAMFAIFSIVMTCPSWWCCCA